MTVQKTKIVKASHFDVASVPGHYGRVSSHPYATGLALIGVAICLSAVGNYQLAKRAERRNPASDRFMEVHGVRFHYIERGDGPPIVLSTATAAWSRTSTPAAWSIWRRGVTG